MKVTKKRRFVIFAGPMLGLYVVSYLVLSRRGYAEADLCSFKGFYYLTPSNTAVWRHVNYGLAILYWPLNRLDRFAGTGRAPASEPMWGLGP